MATVICVAGVVIGATIMERRFAEQGDVSSAKTARHFARWFLLGAGCYLIVLYGIAAVSLLTI